MSLRCWWHGHWWTWVLEQPPASGSWVCCQCGIARAALTGEKDGFTEAPSSPPTAQSPQPQGRQQT